MIRIKNAILLLGDIIILYGALALTILFRYNSSYFKESFFNHLKPFSLIFIIWLVVFYLADLYKDKNFRTDPAAIQIFTLTIVINIVASVVLFYLFPGFFKLTPKTNLAIFSLIFGILDFGLRSVLFRIYISSGLRNRLLIIGDSPIINETISFLKLTPQLGYDLVAQINDFLGDKTERDINKIIASQRVNNIVIQSLLKDDPNIIKAIYKLLSSGIATTDFAAFYEMIFRKLPLDELKEGWFIEKITISRHFYDFLKRIIDITLSLILGIILLPVSAVIAVLIKLDSSGPVIYKQERVGINDKSFILFKFRTMMVDQSGPLWTTKNDRRLTFVGKFLRYTHLDEIPQLYNILRGDISFIGPRPERRELVEFYKQLSYYEIRHIIKPGLTGWAQLNYKPSASLEEAKEKLQYDIYYIKNRSFVLDFLIILKTIKYLFFSNQ